MSQDDRSDAVSRDDHGSDQQLCSPLTAREVMAVAVTVTLPEQHGRCSDGTCGCLSDASRFDKIDRALEQLSLKMEQQRVELREYMGRMFAELHERLAG